MTHTHTRMPYALFGSALLVAGSPVIALAEEENTGMKLLMPNMAEFIPACIAFLIIFVLLSKLAWPMVLKMMEDRENKIQGDLDAAEQSRAEAQASAQEAQDAIASAQREAADIIAAAKREGEQERTRIIAEAQASAVNIVAKGHETVENERQKAMVELSSQVVDLSVEIASKIIGDALDDEEQHRLAEKYLLEVGSLND